MPTPDLNIPSDTPLRTFIPYSGGYLFNTIRVAPGVQVVSTEKDDYNLGIVDAYELSIGKGGVLCGYFFSTAHKVRLLPNALYVYRNKLTHMSTKELLADKGERLLLKYRATSGRGVPLLRIFTMSSDLVVIGSDLPDRMKQKLETQE